MQRYITYEDIYQYANSSLVVIDSKGCVAQINVQAATVLHLDAHNDLAQDIRRILPSIGEAVTYFLQRKSQIFGHQIQGPDSGLVLNIIPIFKNKEFVGGICSFRDADSDYVSTRETSSYKILNRQLEAIIASSSDGIWVCDGNGKVIRINQASEALNGIKAENVVGHHIQDLQDNKVFDQSVTSQVLASGNRETIMQYIAKTNKYLLSTGTPSVDEDGSISLIVVNERDITELNTLRKKFEQSQKVREKYKEELSELALLELEQNTIIAESSGMRNILQLSLKLAHIGASNILILGESGTGKSMLSKLIHKNSNRRKNPFIEINCAALPDTLLEAELFGYEKGAFTGANPEGKAGLFEMANGGTLFLDEIGDMPLPLQTKLLKYLDNNEFRRVGGTESIRVECSVIAATNQNLKELVKQKLFREDLYYRLNSFTLRIPPLRDRPQDISSLVRYYLHKFNKKYSTNKKVGSRTMQAFLHYSFPGNIRELKNIVENGVVMSDSSHVDEFVQVSLGENGSASTSGQDAIQHDPDNFNLQSNLKQLEKSLLIRAKKQYVTTREIARHLGISQPSVVRKLKEHNIHS